MLWKKFRLNIRRDFSVREFLIHLYTRRRINNKLFNSTHWYPILCFLQIRISPVHGTENNFHIYLSSWSFPPTGGYILKAKMDFWCLQYPNFNRTTYQWAIFMEKNAHFYEANISMINGFNRCVYKEKDHLPQNSYLIEFSAVKKTN